MFVLSVPLQTLQRSRRRRPDFVTNQPWPTMLRPGFPQLSHPGLKHAVSSIAYIAQVYRGGQTRRFAHGRTINSERRVHRPDARRAADRGVARVQRLESDDRARPAPVVQHRSMKCARVGSIRVSVESCTNADSTHQRPISPLPHRVGRPATCSRAHSCLRGTRIRTRAGPCATSAGRR